MAHAEKLDDGNGRKPWTVMVYMIADDPAGGELLDQQANRELDDIVFATLGPTRDTVNVAVQVDFRSQPAVWRRLIGKGAWLQPESAAADPETLYGFFDWVTRNCPAYHYLLMFWGHSRGPFGLFTDEPFSSPMGGPFAHDDPRRYVAQTLTLKELRDALGNARECLRQQIDIVAFKDCFMSTLETAYELRDWVRFILASPDIVPVPGWPYQSMLSQLAAGKELQPTAQGILDTVRRHYDVEANRHSLKSVPYSLLDTSKLPTLTGPLDSIIERLTKTAGTRRALLGASPNDPALIDVGILCQRLKALGKDEVTKDAEALEEVVKQVVIGHPEKPRKAKTHKGVKASPPDDDGRLGLCAFRFPSNGDERPSMVAGHATHQVYSDLVIAKETKWKNLALSGMPPDRVPSPDSPTPAYSARYGQTLLPGVLRELERGILEQVARRFGFGPDYKEIGFGPDYKEIGFGPDYKEIGFGPDYKEIGFVKEIGFASRVGLLTPITTQRKKRRRPKN